MKMIRGKWYPEEFVNWMIGIYGKEDLMPSNDDTILLWSIAFEAGRARGYEQGSADTAKLAEYNLI